MKKLTGNWQPLRELALHTPYTMGYLSLMARRKQLKVKKIGRIWYSTMENIKDFERIMREKKEERKNQLRKSYQEKTGNVKIRVTAEENSLIRAINRQFTPSNKVIETEKSQSIFDRAEDRTSRGKGIKISVASDTIFDEVQRELEEVLQEIKEKERRLRQNYIVFRGRMSDMSAEETPKRKKAKQRQSDAAYVKKEKQETEELSEKLIMDLGKLLNTANRIHEDPDVQEVGKGTGKMSLPIKSTRKATHRPLSDITRKQIQPAADINITRAEVKEAEEHLLDNHLPEENFLSVPYNSFPFECRNNDREASNSTQNKLLLFIASLLLFIAMVLLALVIFG